MVYLFLKFEIFSKNLDNLFGANGGGGKGNEREASASVHLSVMGQKVKIQSLFKGYKELISLVWSLPSHMTSFFNVNFLTNDQNEYVVMQNGMLVRVECMGALSFDLSGSSEVSMWSRKAKTRVKIRYININTQKSRVP